MEWNTLLCKERTRKLLGGKDSRTSDLRSEFRRDFGRIVFSTPLRRLEDKAQVFPLEAHDGVRTRLTHTLEVSSLAQDIAQQVGMWLQKKGKITYEQARAIETIAHSCALLHDVGNPPFGHAGEDSIAQWFEKHSKEENFWKGIDGRGHQEQPTTEQLRNDFLHFEGNAHTIRLISRLQLLNDIYGLNLTVATVSAALKYPGGSHQRNKKVHQFKKHGYFASEANLISLIRGKTGTGTNDHPLRNPIALLVEAADDLTYSTVDIEDAVRKKILTWEQVSDGLISEASKIDKENNQEKVVPLLSSIIDDSKSIIDRDQSLDLSPWEKAEAYSIMFRTLVTAKGVKQTVSAFARRYKTIMKGGLHDDILSLCEIGAIVTCCKTFAAKEIYPRTSGIELLGKNVIHDLMDFFWEEVKNCPAKIEEIRPTSFQAKTIKQMSTNYRRIYEHSMSEGKLPPRYIQFQLLTDYICGMTDTFACSLHRKIFNG